jgi:hypothetical protein
MNNKALFPVIDGYYHMLFYKGKYPIEIRIKCSIKMDLQGIRVIIKTDSDRYDHKTGKKTMF